jgi:integrase
MKYQQLSRDNCGSWVKRWGTLICGQITQSMVETFAYERSRSSAATANREIRYLRATFNFGKKRKLIMDNPTDGIEFFPVDQVPRYVPPQEDIDNVIALANVDTRDYLLVIRETLGRKGEINRLCWEDVDFDGRNITLYTRKKKNGNLVGRKVPMTQALYDVLTRRYASTDPEKPWVFWHTYTSSRTGDKKQGPYQDRKKFMRTLCRKADVRYFRFHALRHSGASIMDDNNVPIAAIQKILGHENRSTTEIYLHRLGPLEKDAMATFERVRQKSHTSEERGEG